MEHYSFIYLFIFLVGIILNIPISQFLTVVIFKMLQYIYQHHNAINNRQTLYSCWAGIPSGNLLHIIFTFFIIFMGISSYFNKSLHFLFFSISSLLFFIITCWNSLTRIELTTEDLSIYKIIFGTETEIYKIPLNEIQSVTNKLTMGNFLLGGFYSWLTINLKNGNQIALVSPKKEEVNILLSFLKENNKIKLA